MANPHSTYDELTASQASKNTIVHPDTVYQELADKINAEVRSDGMSPAFEAPYGTQPDTAPKNPNPKDSIGSSKIPMHLWPETATIYGALGLLDGALKYGRSNFRAAPVRASIYYDAAKRHLNAWFEGRPADPDSGLPDLAHALACLAILVDAEAAGTLIDDRMVAGGYMATVEKMTPFVKLLQERHADKSPKHYTIVDTP
jgi:hypothetical protein